MLTRLSDAALFLELQRHIKTRTFPCGAIDAHPDGDELLRNRRTDYVASRSRAEVARTAKEWAVTLHAATSG